MNANAKIFLLIASAAILILGCGLPGITTSWLLPDEENIPLEPSKPNAIPPKETQTVTAQPAGFEPADCNLSGLVFPDMTTGNNEFDPYDGPSLICNSSATGSHELNERMYLSIQKMLPDRINAAFEEQKGMHKAFVDEAIAWKEKNPTAGSEVAKIRDDANGYIYLVITQANVQGCVLGEGYGAEIVDNYLVNSYFSSCEGDAASYSKAVETLRETARKAIERVENNKLP